MCFSCSWMSAETVGEETSHELMYIMSRTLGTLFVLLIAAAILLKKNSLRINFFPFLGRGGNQINIITLNQTVLIKVTLFVDFAAVYVLKDIIDPRSMPTFEMLKLIIIDNICFRFIFPLYLVFNAKSSLPALFSEKQIKKVVFFASKQRH